MFESSIILLLANFKKVILILFVILLITSLSWTYIRRFYYISFLPGPRALPIIGNALLLRGSLEDVSKCLFSDLRKFGAIFRFWLCLHPIVIISKPDHVQKVLTSSHALEKAWLMRYIAGTIFGDGILISLVPKWKRNRKIVKSGFGQGIINSFLPVFVKQSNILVDVLEQELNNTRSFDAFKYLSRATLDTVCDAAMGVDINSQRSNSQYIDALDSELEIMVERAYKVWLHPPFVFNFTSLGKKHKANTQILWGVTDKLIAEKRKKREQYVEEKYDSNDINSGLQKNPFRKPILDFLLDYMETDKQFTCDQLREELNIVILGAYETAARSLSYLFMVLGKYKEIQQRVYDEIFSIFGNSQRSIELSDFQNLQYMDMVIKESMRFFPTIPYIVREIANDIQIDKYTIPKSTTCLVSIAYTHYDNEIWENPTKFDPDRFLPENIKKRHQFSYIPFSAGPRDCIGVKYAMMYMKTVLTTVLRNYEIHTDLELDKCEFRLELSLKLIGGHLVKVTPRHQQ